MNLDWSKPYRLKQRLNPNPPDTGVCRIQYEGQASTVAYIGESSNVPSRLYNHKQTFGGTLVHIELFTTELTLLLLGTGVIMFVEGICTDIHPVG